MPSEEITEAIVRLSKGVPGAVAVLCKLVEAMSDSNSAELVLHALELTPLTGSEIWTRYKDIYGGDISAFALGVVNDFIRTHAPGPEGIGH